MAASPKKRGSRGSSRGYGRGYNLRSSSNNYKHNTSPFSSSPFSSAHNTSHFNSSVNENDLSVGDLRLILIPSFAEEVSFLDTLEREVTNTLFQVHKMVAADVNILDVSMLEKTLPVEEFDFAGGDSLELRPLPINGSSSEVIQALLLDLEKLGEVKNVASKKNQSNELEIKNLQATIDSLLAQLKKYEKESEAQLKKKTTELQKNFEEQIKKTNDLLKAEKEKSKANEAECKKEIQVKKAECQKEIEAKVQAAKAEYDTKSKALTEEKLELENRLREQIEKNEELFDQAEILRDELKLKEKQVLEVIQEIIKKECECPICFGILDNLITTTCGHTFCKICIEEWRSKENGAGKCPVCRRNCVDGNIYFFNDVIGQFKKKFPTVDWGGN